MSKKSSYTFVTGIALLIILLAACGSSDSSNSDSKKIEGTAAPDYTGKKVLWVDSYHEGYAWSDGINQGIHNILDNTGVELKIIHMDTKQNPDNAEAAGREAKAVIDEFKPDVVIASDDNAQIYLVVPYLLNTDTPVVFCAVNWDASEYGFPAQNVTGMLEVDPGTQLHQLLHQYAKGERVGFLSIDTESERKVATYYNDNFFDGQMKTYFVSTFAELKDVFLKIQGEEVDILYLNNNAGAPDWDDEAAKVFFLENTTVPTGSSNDWMAPYSLLILGKQASEQGEWSATAALSIINGTPVSDIPMTKNQEGRVILNLDIADAMGVTFEPSLLKVAEIYSSQEGE